MRPQPQIGYLAPVKRLATCHAGGKPLHCNTLQHTATHCNTLHHTATHCNTLQHTGGRRLRSETLIYSVVIFEIFILYICFLLCICLSGTKSRSQVHIRYLHSQYFEHSQHFRVVAQQVVCCSVMQCVTVCCSVLQCFAVCCSVLQCVAVYCSVLRCVVVYRSVLQYVVACCSVLQLECNWPMK